MDQRDRSYKFHLQCTYGTDVQIKSKCFGNLFIKIYPVYKKTINILKHLTAFH